MSRGLIVSIDGPVGVGKSTVAKDVASKLGLIYIDTGAMYRAITLKAMNSLPDLTDVDAVGALANETTVSLVRTEKGLRIECDGRDVSDDIRSPEVSRNTSPIADNVHVRERLVALQQEMGAVGNIIMEGRDIGTVVFPNADVKIYLDAKAETRAERRHAQWQSQGKDVNYEDTLRDLNERDRRDRARPVGALKIAEDAVVVDSTTMNQEEVVQHICDLVRSHEQKPDGEA